MVVVVAIVSVVAGFVVRGVDQVVAGVSRIVRVGRDVAVVVRSAGPAGRVMGHGEVGMDYTWTP